MPILLENHPLEEHAEKDKGVVQVLASALRLYQFSQEEGLGFVIDSLFFDGQDGLFGGLPVEKLQTERNNFRQIRYTIYPYFA